MAHAPSFLDRLRDPQADPPRDRARLRLAAMMAAMGVLHFVVPGPFRSIVPRWFPWAREAVMWSGVAELTTGVLVAVPRTSRIGGALGVATIAAVYPANVQMAVDASRRQYSEPGRSEVPGQPDVPGPSVKMPAWAAWLRLPLQVPLLLTALRIARG